MKIPRTITPNSLREAIVEVKFSTDFPSELLPGVLVDSFDETYFYTNRRPRPISPLGNLPTDGNELKTVIGTYSFLYNDKIILQILPSSILFTCLGAYIGWPDYFTEIMKALQIVNNTKKIEYWTRVGLRYISEYPSQDLRETTKFDFHFGHPEVKSESVSFRSQFVYKGATVFLNLSNLVPLETVVNDEQHIVPTSLIDIDVINELQKTQTFTELEQKINETHVLEKELFFNMLKEEFLQTLQPQY